MRWKSAGCLLVLTALPTALGRALLSSENEISHGNLTQTSPTQIRSTLLKRLSDKCARDYINGSPIWRRGQACCRGGSLVIGDDEECEGFVNKKPEPETESDGFAYEVCESDSSDSETGTPSPSEPSSPNSKPYSIDECVIEVDTEKPPYKRPRPFIFVPELRSPESLRERGKRGLALAANPKQGPDFNRQIRENYFINVLTDEEALKNDRIEDRVRNLDFFRKYGFDADKGWKTVWVHSTGNLATAVVVLCVGKATKDDKDYVAIVALQRFASHDSNRFLIDEDGYTVFDYTTRPVVRPTKDVEEAVPVAQLVYRAARASGMLDGKPDKIFLVSDKIVNRETQRDIYTAEAAMDTSFDRQETQLRPNAAGIEGEMCELIAGNDNTFSYLNTIGRNPETFWDYKIEYIETQPWPFMITIELSHKD